MLDLPPHTLRRLLDTGSALLVTPMEPQPEKVEWAGGEPWFWVPVACGECGVAPHRVGEFAPHQPGDAVTIAPRQECTNYGYKYAPLAATVTTVEAKRVAEIGIVSWENSGLNDLQGNPDKWSHIWWRNTYPDHPFDSAWCWVESLTTEKHDANDLG